MNDEIPDSTATPDENPSHNNLSHNRVPRNENPLQSGTYWRAVEFHATGASYFGIWIVNLVLTLLTLGIYSAWATVRERRYLYGCVEVAESRFDFHGKPLQILVGRIIAVLLLVAWTQGHYIHIGVQYAALAIILVLFPWFFVRAMAFRLRNTSLRNLRFDFRVSARAAYGLFGKYLLAMALLIACVVWAMFTAFGGLNAETMQQKPGALVVGLFVGVYLVAMVAFSFLYPALICDMRRFSVNHTLYGNHPFSVELKRWEFIGYFWTAIGIAILASIGTSILVAVIIAVSAISAGSSGNTGTVIVGIFISYLLFGLCYLVAYAYWQVKIFNRIFANLSLKEGVRFRSRIEVIPLSKILLGNALLIMLTLGLAYPWAKVRLMRYKLEAIQYLGDADQFTGSGVSDNAALGDEVGDAFDLDFGFGF